MKQTMTSDSQRPKVPKRVRNHVNPLGDLQEHSFEGFTNSNPIIVDIGSYRGEFIEALVAHFGIDKNFIACEIRKPYAKYLDELFLKDENVVVFDGDTGRNFEAIIKPSQDKGVLIQYVFINFPDPWFKDRHKKRRVINPKFLQATAQWIDSETTFVFQTDQEQLFRDTQELLDQENIKYKEFDKPLWGAQTYWEIMKIEEGDSIYRMSFTF